MSHSQVRHRLVQPSPGRELDRVGVVAEYAGLSDPRNTDIAAIESL